MSNPKTRTAGTTYPDRDSVLGRWSWTARPQTQPLRLRSPLGLGGLPIVRRVRCTDATDRVPLRDEHEVEHDPVNPGVAGELPSRGVRSPIIVQQGRPSDRQPIQTVCRLVRHAGSHLNAVEVKSLLATTELDGERFPVLDAHYRHCDRSELLCRDGCPGLNVRPQ